jgi:hypothetical protein
MPETNENDAWYCLETGALGIGEEHTQPAGRQLAIELIDSGLVTNLFVEFAQEQFRYALQAAQKAVGQGRDIEEVARLAPNSNLFKNRIPLGRVIAMALLAHIPVHLADHYIMASYPNDFRRRHTTIKNTFRAVTNQQQDPPYAIGENCIGCLLLWGGKHFEGNQQMDRYIIGLPFIMMG